MKKTIILILGGATALALSLIVGISVMSQSNSESDSGLFETNVEALAGVEHWGSCGNVDPYCQDLCPNCRKITWAEGYKGPGNLTNCTCSQSVIEK